jgi:hypothetical protein
MIDLADRIENTIYDILAGNISLKDGIRKIRRMVLKMTPNQWRGRSSVKTACNRL